MVWKKWYNLTWCDMIWQHVVEYIISLYWLRKCLLTTHWFFGLLCQDLRVTESLRYSPVWQTRSAFDVGRPKTNLGWWMHQVDGWWLLRLVVFVLGELAWKGWWNPNAWGVALRVLFRCQARIRHKDISPRSHQKVSARTKSISEFLSFLCFKQLSDMQLETVA